MPSRIDLKVTAYRDQGFTGALLDMELQWLQNGGATSENRHDAWREMLDFQGYKDWPAVEDAWYQLLGVEGYTGTLLDREDQFYAAGGILPGGGGGGFSIIDFFTDTNGVILQNHTPDVVEDGGWSANSDVQIQSNMCENTAGATTYECNISAGAGNDDKEVTATLQAFAGADMVLSRTQDASNHIGARMATAGIALELVTVTGSTPTVRGSQFNGGAAYPLEIKAISNGNDHTVKATGFTDVNWTGAFLTGQIDCGLVIAAGQIFDNFDARPPA